MVQKQKISKFTIFQNLLKISKNQPRHSIFHPILRILVKFYHLSLFFEKIDFHSPTQTVKVKEMSYSIHFHREFKEISSNLHRSYRIQCKLNDLLWIKTF